MKLWPIIANFCILAVASTTLDIILQYKAIVQHGLFL